MKKIICMLLVLLLAGCSGQPNTTENHKYSVSITDTWELSDQITSQSYLWNGNVYFAERGSDPMAQNFLAKNIKKLNYETGQLETLIEFADPVQLAGFAELNHGMIMGIYQNGACELVYSDGEYGIAFDTIPITYNGINPVNIFRHNKDVYVLWQGEESDGIKLHCRIYNADNRQLKDDTVIDTFDTYADIDPTFIEDTLYLKCMFHYDPDQFRMIKMENNEVTKQDNEDGVTNLIPLKEGYLTEKKDGCYFGSAKCGNFLDCPEEGIYLPNQDLYFGQYHSSENVIALFWEEDEGITIQYIGTDDIDGLEWKDYFQDQNVSYTSDGSYIYGIYTRNNNIVIQKFEVKKNE